MTWFRVGGSGIPAALKSRMNAVLNKKFGTAIDYPPNGWPDDVNLMGPLPEATVSATIAVIEDGANDVPTKSVKIAIPASLSGVSAVTETQIPSRNMASMSDADFTLNSVRYKTENGVLYIDGTSTGETSSNNDAFKVLDFWLPSGTYYFSRGSLANVNVATYLRKYDDKTEIKANQGSFTLAEKTHVYISFYVYNKVFSDLKATICINLGSTAITYEDTAPMTTYTASLGRTIYGGEVDIVNGVGQDYALWVNLSDIAWTEDANRTGVFYGAVTGRKTATADEPSDVLGCTCYDVNNVNVTTSIDNYISGARSYGGNIIFFRDSSFHGYTRAQVQEALQGEKVCVVSANPTDFTFTGQEVPTRLGYNAFWSDEGDTEVTYRRDINLALQAVSNNRGLMMASRPAIEQTSIDQGSEESTENNVETEGE